MFEFNNKGTRTRPNFASLVNVSIVDFEQVNVNWAVSFRIVKILILVFLLGGL